MKTIDLVTYIVLLVVIATLFIYILRLRYLFKKQYEVVAFMMTKNQLLVEKLSDAYNKMDQKPAEQTDGFLKFISESRDWAFNYIENVQHAIFVLKEKYDDGEDIEQSIKELFEMLPDNKEK